MSTKQVAIPTTEPASMGFFQAIGQTLASTVSVVSTTARTVEKSVALVEQEVDHLAVLQNIRMDDARSKLAILIE